MEYSTIHSDEFGKINLYTLPLPEDIILLSGTYTASGRVAVNYRKNGDSNSFMRIATVNDDGSNFIEIFAGEAPLNPRANGFRFMCFEDNTRALTGDYVFEAEPDMDHPGTTRMVPLKYPEELVNFPGLWMLWSEIVIAPDNEHMAWSTLTRGGSDVYTGRLVREADCYTIADVQHVSTQGFVPDPDHEGCVVEIPTRGGEVKQFIRGGRALSYVGVGRGCGSSMVQMLDSEEVLTVSKAPSYDETTLFSPDEKLGIVMSSRVSPATNSAVVGMIPRRGNIALKHGLAMNAYLLAVAAVRAKTKGNVGPALVFLDRAMKDYHYTGVNLSDPEEEWVYYSPMSWHPSSRKCMWNEGLRKTIGNGMRLRIAVLEDYKPAEKIRNAGFPETVPYAVPGIQAKAPELTQNIRIAGKYSGFAVTEIIPGMPMKTVVKYENFSDDGLSFLNGEESVVTPGLIGTGNTVYDAKLVLTGAHTGESDVHLIYERPGREEPVQIAAESRGYAVYDGVRAEVQV